MRTPKPGDVVSLKVRTSFKHYSNRMGTGRFVGLPCLQVRLSAQPKDPFSLAGVVPWLGRSTRSPKFDHIPPIDAIVDTGASRCVISSSDAYNTFALLRGQDITNLSKKAILLPNGTPMNGHEMKMEMEVVGIKGTWTVPFLISDALKTPVLLSWKQLRAILPPIWWIDGTSLILGDIASK